MKNISQRNILTEACFAGAVPPRKACPVIEGDELESASVARQVLPRHPAPPRAGLRCPECGSIIYSRRQKLCGVCGHELPAELLFSKEQAQRVQCLIRSEQRRHRTWMGKALRQALAPSFMHHSLR